MNKDSHFSSLRHIKCPSFRAAAWPLILRAHTSPFPDSFLFLTTLSSVSSFFASYESLDSASCHKQDVASAPLFHTLGQSFLHSPSVVSVIVKSSHHEPAETYYCVLKNPSHLREDTHTGCSSRIPSSGLGFPLPRSGMPLDDERKIVVSFGSRCISSVVDDSRVATTERFASETGGRQQEFQRRCYVRHMTILTIGIAIAVSR
jgi:hypothetical protein